MTPAINVAKKNKLDFNIHQYEHSSSCESYGAEAAEKLSVSADLVFKTLVVITDEKTLAVAILPVNKQLSLKKVAQSLQVKKVAMADPKQVERVTGYVLGGVSPLGQRKQLPSVIDRQALTSDTIYVSAGRRGLEIELPALQLADVISAKFTEITD